MSNRINIDDVFRGGLGGHELPFDESAWANMQHKLADDAVKPKFWLPFLSKKTTKLFITMTFLTTLISSMFWLNAIGNTHANSAGNTENSSAAISAAATVKINASHESALKAIGTENTVRTNSKATTKAITVAAPISQKTKTARTSSSASSTPIVKAESPKVAGNKTISGIRKPSRELIRKPKLDGALSISNPIGLKPQFKFLNNDEDEDVNALNAVFGGGGGHYDCATFGIHFNYVSPMKNYANSGQMPGMGFDMEVFSPNILPFGGVRFFAGVSGSIAWMGKSPKTAIALNTPNNDPGKTFLQSNLGDVNLMGKLEIGPGNLKLYGTVFGGWRFHTVSQSIVSDKAVSGFENTSNQIWSNNSLQWGLGAGLRYHFAPTMSLDVRGMYNDVDFMRLANVKESSFNSATGKYTLSYNGLDPQTFSLRIGFVFCIHDAHDSYNHTNTNATPNTIPNTPPSNRRNPIRIRTTPKVSTPHNIRVTPKVSTPHKIRVAPKVNN